MNSDMDNYATIRPSFKSIVLLCIFVKLSTSQDTCNYNVFPRERISGSQAIPVKYTNTLESNDAKECGEECCDEERCSAAMFKENTCVLVDCNAMGGCVYDKTEDLDVSLILVLRGENITVSNEEVESSTLPASESLTTEGKITSTTTSKIPDTKEIASELIQPVVTDKPPNLTTARNIIPPTTITILETTTSKTEEIKTTSSTEASTPTVQDSGLTETPLLTTTVLTTTTVPTTKSTLPIRKKLTVSSGGNQEIRLPKDSVTIHSAATPPSDDEYDYQWRLIKHPEDFQGTQSGIETETLKLTTLTVGDYEFKVEVTGENAYGEDFVNVTVLPKLRVNQPPVAIISPPFQELTLPTDSTLLDGSKSSDDDEIVKYEWEEVQGPLQANINKDENGNLPNTKVLQLTGLTVGNYTFKLTVTDTDKVTDSTQAVILVKKKIDNPPIANAGSNQVIHMPQHSAVLCGNDSTDDWGIKGYKWSLSPDSKNEVVDMQGARSQCLELSNLEVGDYTFQLQVTDDAGQEDSAKVTIIVQPESNHPPISRAGEDQQLLLPLDNGIVTANLDGIKSSDDKAITTVLWTMTDGPQTATIVKSNSLTTTVTGITKAGKYTFTLTVTDEDGASSSDDVVITVKDEQPPIVNAGPDLTITLPDNVAMLDGSKSTDDYGIVEYEWTRTDESPAAGFILNHSDHQAVLHVAGLVQGEYTFMLKVTNIRGKASSDETKLKVIPDPRIDNLVELHLDANILHFDEKHKQTVMRQLGVLLSLQADDEVIVRSIYAEHGTGHMIVLFYIKTKDKHVLRAIDVSDSLNSKLKSDVDFLDFKFVRADTYVCENLCSSHGRCHAGSKECECDIFWMENFFRVYLGDGKRNCEWSVMYVGIICFLILTFISCSLWFLACCCLRTRHVKSPYKRRKNYSSHDKTKYEKLPLKPQRNGPVRKNGYVRNSSLYKASSIMRSASSSSSLSNSEGGRETTLFEKKRLLMGNGNGTGRFKNGYVNDEADRKISSSSVGKNNSAFKGERNVTFSKVKNGGSHQSALLRVGNTSGEDEVL